MWQLLVALVMMVIAYVLMPKPKTSQRPPAVQDLKEPTVEDGPVQVPFGTNLHKSVNVLWYGEKYIRQHKEDA